ncbi:MAG: hypothetical protein SGI77_00150 [Pirellulaceae bacterium]|nr:hypothetical protein [Pirellulaceae bacterium]
MNEHFSVPKNVHIVPDDQLRLVEGTYVFDINTRSDYEDHVVCMPHFGENHSNVADLKLKLLCRKKGIRLSTFGHLNQFSEMGILADTVIAQPGNGRLNKLYGDQISTCWVDQKLIQKVTDARFVEIYKMRCDSYNFLLSRGDCDPNWGKEVTAKFRKERALMVEAIETINDEEVIDAFVWPDIYIRQSTWDLFHELDLPNDMICSESKSGGPRREAVREWLMASRFPNVGSLDQEFQHNLLRKVGAHYMGIQFLASWLKNWMFVCMAGSANLFTIMPVKGLVMYDNKFRNPSTQTCLRGLACRRYGSLGNDIPVFLPEGSRSSLASYLDTKRDLLFESIAKLKECRYGIKPPEADPHGR